MVVLRGLAAFRWPGTSSAGREELYTFFTLGLLFPAGAAILPLLPMLRDLDLVNTYSA